ncbi:MAG TPA: spore photoproduct lyase [Clostridia bacterium]|nr:spore photoproduct lyase [Clostridia bacterium]
MFQPKRVYFEPEALEYPLGRQLYERFKDQSTPIFMIKSHNRVTGIPGKAPREAYLAAKSTLVVGVRRTLDFATCKPSAHYQLPLSTSCTGRCQYCYLNTTLGKKPYVRVYVNLDEILARAKEYIRQRTPDITVFEGSATSDPVPVEPYTGSLAKTILFFSREPLGRFRFVTKFTDLDTLLDLDHRGHTEIRFSINTDYIIKSYEQGTPNLPARIRAAGQVARAGYPLGFLIAPIFHYHRWQEDYAHLLRVLKEELGPAAPGALTFELISHRFTAAAKKRILEVFPDTTLPLEEENRKFKFGQFGYGKYVYPPAVMEEIKSFFHREIEHHFPRAKIAYLV